MIYLAFPYSYPDLSVDQLRFEAVYRAVGLFMIVQRWEQFTGKKAERVGVKEACPIKGSDKANLTNTDGKKRNLKPKKTPTSMAGVEKMS